MLFSGVFFPVESLPPWARSFAWLLPLTHAVSLCRTIASGELATIVLVNVAYVVLATGVALALAARWVRRRLLV